jgi:hypothetical protein
MGDSNLPTKERERERERERILPFFGFYPIKLAA